MWWISSVYIMCPAGSLRQQKPVCCQGEHSLGKQWPGSVQSQQWTTQSTIEWLSLTALVLSPERKTFQNTGNANCLALTRMKYWFWRGSKTSRWIFRSNFHVLSQHLEIQKTPIFPVTVLLKRWHCTYRLPLPSALGVNLNVYLKQDGAVPKAASVENFPGQLGGGWSPVSVALHKIIKGLGWKGP